MNTCEHVTWLRFSRAEQLTIHDEGRLSRLIADFTNASCQKPSLLYFVGRSAKDVALRELFPYNSLRRRRSTETASVVNLRIDNVTLNSDHPILFADSEPTLGTTPQVSGSTCHEVVAHAVQWHEPTLSKFSSVLYARLLIPFMDVLCLFGDDFNSLDDVITLLKSWAAAGVASHLPRTFHPKVILVVTGDEASATFNVLQAQDLKFGLYQQDLIGFFSSITVLYLTDAAISPLARHRRLKEVLLRHADETRQTRQASRVLFSATHFHAFFQRALKHCSLTEEAPFNFVLASRRATAVSDDYSEHLKTYLRLTAEAGISCNDQASYIASSMLMDAYPPRMHVFDPMVIFRHLYQRHTHIALVMFFNSTLAGRLCQCIETHFRRWATIFLRSAGGAANIHRANARNNARDWIQLKSNRTCLCCLRRRPEWVLSCGHAICEVCTRVFGEPTSTAGYRFHVKGCTLCSSGTLVAQLKPPTAGLRILSVDGGGVRGVIPLKFLSSLQQCIGPNIPIQDLFDLAIGTSSGGLIVLSLFSSGWDVAHCNAMFDVLSREFFCRRQQGPYGLLRHFRHMLRCWFSDGYYDVERLETSLKEHFGLNRRMFDQTSNGTRIGVTATTISDALPYLFSNYNGVKEREKNCGYKHVRPLNVADEPYVWEAGRVTSAAPVLFKPAEISMLGTFQDGGLKHNNPVNLALWESQQIWPSTNIDIVLSLGTGTTKASGSPSAPNFRHIMLDGFIPRLYRSFMSSLDGQSTWQELQNRLDKESRMDYFRLNVCLSDNQWTIDDVNCMPGLRECVNNFEQRQQLVTDVVHAALLSSFFFELIEQPKFATGFYLCRGVIRCRIEGYSAIEALNTLRPSHWAIVTDTELLGYVDTSDTCSLCRCFQKSVRLTVRHPTDLITIYLQCLTKPKRKISGFPQTMQWFVNQQFLDEEFGTPFHDAMARRCCRQCDLAASPRRLKRKSSTSESDIWSVSRKSCKRSAIINQGSDGQIR